MEKVDNEENNNLMNKEEKHFLNIQSDFYHYMITEGGLTPKTSRDYISRLKFLSATYHIDNTLDEEGVEEILRKEEVCYIERSKYNTRKSISDFRSGLRKFLDFLKSDYHKRYENSILSEIKMIKENHHLSVTEKEAIILSRRGQGVFRNDLIKYWGGCAISKCSLTDILVASHIKPWKDSTNDKRLDVFNGLLLLPNYDKLFDLGYITFNPEGKVLYSKLLSKNDKYLLGLTATLSLCRIEEAHKSYLKYHKDYCFID